MHENNPVCGDDLTVYCTIENDKIKDVKFDGQGCSISVAAASMLTDFVKGKTLKEVEEMDNKKELNEKLFIHLVFGGGVLLILFGFILIFWILSLTTSILIKTFSEWIGLVIIVAGGFICGATLL